MRPKSAVSKRTNHNRLDENKYESSVLRTEYLQLNSRIKPQSKSSTSKISQIRTVSNAKNIGLIHAYQPELLKNCLVRNRGSYREFLSRTGDCKAPDIFMKSFITHFREWRKDIHHRLASMCQLILQNRFQQDDAQRKIRLILGELQGYSTQLKQSLEEIMVAKAESIQASQMLKKYEELIYTIKRVISLVDGLFKFTKQVTLFMAQNDDLDLCDPKKIQKQLQIILKAHLNRMAQEMGHCHAQTESEILLKIQYNVRQKMVKINRGNLQVVESIKTMRDFEKSFRVRLENLQRSQAFDCQYLQKVVEFLYFKNQEIKLNEKKFEIVPKVKDTVYHLRSQIQAIQNHFIQKFRFRCLEDAKATLATLAQLRILELVRSRGKEYVEAKKKMILVVKVLQESERESGVDENNYQKERKAVSNIITAYSNALRNISLPLQTLIQKIESSLIFKERSALAGPRALEKTLEEVIEIEQLQKKIWSIAKILHDELAESQGENRQAFAQPASFDSKTLTQLEQILIFTRNEKQNNQIFGIVESLQQELSQVSRKKQAKATQSAEMVSLYEVMQLTHDKFARNGLQQGLIRNNQLKRLNTFQLIQYLFQNQFASQFISNYPSIKNVTDLISKLTQAVDRLYINHAEFSLLSDKDLERYRADINQQIKNIEKSQFKALFNRYVILLYESSLIRLLNLRYILKLEAMSSQDTSDYSVIVQRVVEVYEGVLSKAKKEQNGFSELLFTCYQIATGIHNEHRFVLSYRNSAKTGVYYPSLSVIGELINLEYSVQIEETMSKQSAKTRREQIGKLFLYSIKKLEAIRQKIKMKVLLNQNHPIYADISRTLALLRTITFDEDYAHLLSKLLTLLRIKQIRHSAIYCQDRSPIYLLPHFQTTQQANFAVYVYLHSNLSQTRHNLLQKFIFDDSSDHRVKDLQKGIEKFDVQPAGNTAKKERTKRAGMQDQMVEQIECLQIEESGLKVDSNIRQEEVIQSFIEQQCQFAESKIIKPATNSKGHSWQAQYPQNNKPYSYFLINAIKNVPVLKKCLLYRNNEHSFIKERLKLELFCNPEDKKKLFAHIDQILLEVRQSDLMRRMGVQYQETKCEQVLRSFMEAVSSNCKQKEALAKLLEYFGFKTELLYHKGSNKVQAIHQSNQLPYLKMSLVQNQHKINISKMQTQAFFRLLWSEIKLLHHLNSNLEFSNISSKLIHFVIQTNLRLKEHYYQVQSDLRQIIKLKHANSQQSHQKVSEFMTDIVGSQIYLPAAPQQLTSLRSVLQVINQLAISLAKIKVLEPFYTLHCEEVLLCFSGQKISQEQVLQCMMVDQIDFPIAQSLKQKGNKLFLSYDAMLENIKKLMARPALSLELVKQMVNNREAMLSAGKQATQSMGSLKAAIGKIQLLRLITRQSYGQITKQSLKFQSELQVINFISKLHESKQRLAQPFQTNRCLNYSNTVYSTDNSRTLTHNQLLELYQLLLAIPLKCYQVRLESKIVALTKELSIDQAICSINANKNPSASQFFIAQQQHITISQLKIYITNIIPSFSQPNNSSFDSQHTQAQQLIRQYLQSSVLQVRFEGVLESYKCSWLYFNTNSIELQVDWHKPPISLRVINKQQEVQLDILSHNYLFFIQFEPTLIQTYFKEQYQQIRRKVSDERRRAEEAREQERTSKELQQREEQKMEAQRELEMMRIQQNKFKIRLQNEEIQMRMRLLQEEKLSRERQEAERRHQEELRKQQEQLRKQQEQLRKQQEEQTRLLKEQQKQQLEQKRKLQLQNLGKRARMDQEGSELNVSVVLSEGHSVRHAQQATQMFPGLRLRQVESQIQYDLTLSQNLHGKNR